VRPFVAGLIAIAAMVLSLELVTAASGGHRRDPGLTPDGDFRDFPGISYSQVWYRE